MGRPLKLAETVASTLKIGIIGDTALAGDQIQFTGFVAGGSAKTGFAAKQTASKTFRITTADGTAKLRLVPAASGNIVAGECQLTATDSDGGTYHVSKISRNFVTLVPVDGTQFSAGERAKWVFSGPELNFSVSIPGA